MPRLAEAISDAKKNSPRIQKLNVSATFARIHAGATASTLVFGKALLTQEQIQFPWDSEGLGHTPRLLQHKG